MQLSQGVEWALHCCTLLGVAPGLTLSGRRLAEFHGVPEAYLAKHLQSLSRAGIVESLPGARGGYRLARAPRDISVLDVVEAIDGRGSTFRCTEIRQRGPAKLPRTKYPKPCGIHALMDRADAAWRAELASASIADIVMSVARDAHPDGLAKGAKWLTSAMR